MNLLIKNTTIIFIPIYKLTKNGDLSLTLIIILSIFMIFVLIAGFLTYQMIQIIYLSRILHRNLNIIVISILFHWIECSVGRVFLFLYEKGLLKCLSFDSPKEVKFWLTDNTRLMPRIDSFQNILPLVVSSFLTIHYLICLGFSFLFGTIERLFATYFISDYEKNQRIYIGVIIWINYQIISFLVTYSVLFQFISIATTVFIMCFVIFVSTCLYVYVWFLNVKIEQKLSDRKKRYYSLPIRFQAKENAKMLSFFRSILICGLCVTVVELFLLRNLLFGQFFGLKPTHLDETLYEILLFCNALNPFVFVPICIWSVPSWRLRFFRKFGIDKAEKKTEISVKNMSDTYFINLKQNWI